MINVSAATVSASSLARSLGDGVATGHIQRTGLVGIWTVTKLANRVAARFGRSDIAPVFIGWRRTAFQNYQCDGSGGHGGHCSAQRRQDTARAVSEAPQQDPLPLDTASH